MWAEHKKALIVHYSDILEKKLCQTDFKLESKQQVYIFIHYPVTVIVFAIRSSYRHLIVTRTLKKNQAPEASNKCLTVTFKMST